MYNISVFSPCRGKRFLETLETLPPYTLVYIGIATELISWLMHSSGHERTPT